MSKNTLFRGNSSIVYNYLKSGVFFCMNIVDKCYLWLYMSQVMTWCQLISLVCGVTSHHQDLKIKLVKEKKTTNWLFSLKFNFNLLMWHAKKKLLCISVTSWLFVNYSPSSVMAPALEDKSLYMGRDILLCIPLILSRTENCSRH